MPTSQVANLNSMVMVILYVKKTLNEIELLPFPFGMVPLKIFVNLRNQRVVKMMLLMRFPRSLAKLMLLS